MKIVIELTQDQIDAVVKQILATTTFAIKPITPKPVMHERRPPNTQNVPSTRYHDDHPIHMFEFPTRLHNILVSEGIHLVRNLRYKPDGELLRTPGIGPLFLSEIRQLVPYEKGDPHVDQAA